MGKLGGVKGRLPLAQLAHGILAWALVSSGTAVHAAPAATKDAVVSSKLFDEASEQVFKVGIATSMDGELRGHGTGFVVGESGLIATAYHVVESVLSERKIFRVPDVYVVRKGVRMKARVWAVDSVHDMAILKVNAELRAPWPIAPGAQKRGDRFFLLGFPSIADFAIVDGVLQSDRFSEIIPTYQLTASVKGGMSGGPVLSPKGEVVGMILAGLQGGGDVAFAGQAQPLKVLLERALDRLTAPDREELREEARKGGLKLQELQSKLIQGIFAKQSSFHGWMLPSTQQKDSGDVLCGEADVPVAAAPPRYLSSRKCRFKMASGEDEVSFFFEYSVVPFQKNQFKMADVAGRLVNKNRDSEDFEEKFGKFACEPDLRLKGKGSSFLVSVCSRVRNSSMDSFHTVVRVASLDFQTNAIVGQMDLVGFNRANTGVLVDKFIHLLEVDREFEPEEDE